MKKFHYIILFFALTLILSIIFLNSRKGSFVTGEMEFSVRDTARVQSIFINSEKDSELILKREKSGWVVNGDFQASQVAVDNFLFVMSRLQVRGIANEDLKANEPEGIKVEVTSGRKKLVFRFYSKNNTDYAYKDGSSHVFPVHVFGFPDLRLSQVVVPEPNYWRDRLIFSFNPDEISAIEVLYPAMLEKSFAIVQAGDSLRLFNPVDNVFYPEEDVMQERMQMYTTYFMDVFFDEVVDDQRKSDSILAHLPTLRLSIHGIHGNTMILETWPVNREGKIDERYIYMRRNEESEILISRQIIMDLWRKEPKDFLFR